VRGIGTRVKNPVAIQNRLSSRRHSIIGNLVSGFDGRQFCVKQALSTSLSVCVRDDGIDQGQRRALVSIA
jgi:hypothetical protein